MLLRFWRLIHKESEKAMDASQRDLIQETILSILYVAEGLADKPRVAAMLNILAWRLESAIELVEE